MIARQPSVPNLMAIRFCAERIWSASRWCQETRLRRLRVESGFPRVSDPSWSAFDSLPHFLNGSAKVRPAEKSGTADEGIRAGLRAFGGGFEVDSSIHSNVELKFFLTPPVARLLDLGQGFINKGLSSETRVHSHNEQRIDLVEIGLNHRDGGRWIDRQTDLIAERLDFPEQRRDMLAQLDVDIHLVCARFCEWFQQDLRLRAHQMDVEKKFSQRTNRANHC